MRLRNKLTVLGLVAALSVLVVAPAAQAAEGETTVIGRGWLYAKGTGTATLDMKGTMRMRIDGDVVVNDLAGDIAVEIVSGPAPDSLGSEVVLRDFHGTLLVRGSHFTVEAEGRMAFTARGVGVAHLQGRGYWKTRHSRPHPWGGVVRIAEQPAAAIPAA